MLVLTRKINQRIKLSNDVTITVVRVSGGLVRLGIEAPADVVIDREEIDERRQREGFAVVPSGKLSAA